MAEPLAFTPHAEPLTPTPRDLIYCGRVHEHLYIIRHTYREWEKGGLLKSPHSHEQWKSSHFL